MPEFADEFVYRAYVKDDTGEFFARFDKFAENYRQKAAQAFDASTTGADHSAAAIGVLTGVVTGLTTKLVELGLQVLKTFPEFIKQSTELAARVDTLSINVYRIGERMGHTQEQTDGVVDSLKDLGITTQGAYNSLLLLSRANIDWSEATTLARVAQDSAVIAGINSTEAFERLARGIQKMEPELLDELGITLRRTEAYERYAQQMGLNAKQLTDVQQKQAILNEIYRQSGVVAGSYEASLETAGKRAASLARHVEELQLAIGAAFQPVYKAKIDAMTEALKLLREFVEDNKELLMSMGVAAGQALTFIIKGLLIALEVGLKFASAMVKINESIKVSSELMGIQEEELKAAAEYWHRIGVAAGQAISIIVGGLSGAISVVKQVQSSLQQILAAYADFATGKIDITQLGDISGQVLEQLNPSSLGQQFKDQFQDTFQGVADAFNLIDQPVDSTKLNIGELSDESNALLDTLGNLTNAVEDGTVAFYGQVPAIEQTTQAVDNLASAQDALNEIRKQYSMEEADRLRQEQRQAIEDAIQLSFQRQAIERRYQESIQDIQQRAAQQRADAEEDYQQSLIGIEKDKADERLDVEKRHQENLQNIRRDFDVRAHELAKSRDAIGLVRLIEDNKRKLAEEELSRQKDLQDVEENYQDKLIQLQDNYAEQQQQLEQSLEEQLAAADAARVQDYENLERSLDEQRTLKNLHDKWAEEDRQIALQRQLADWKEQYLQMEGITEQSLNNMLGSWQKYFGNVGDIIAQGMEGVSHTLTDQDIANLTQNNQQPAQQQPSGGGVIDIFGNITPIPTIQLPSSVATSAAANGVQSSHQYTHASSQSYNRNENVMTVNGDGLSPYIQQQLLEMLTELEG